MRFKWLSYSIVINKINYKLLNKVQKLIFIDLNQTNQSIRDSFKCTSLKQLSSLFSTLKANKIILMGLEKYVFSIFLRHFL